MTKAENTVLDKDSISVQEWKVQNILYCKFTMSGKVGVYHDSSNELSKIHVTVHGICLIGDNLFIFPILFTDGITESGRSYELVSSHS